MQSQRELLLEFAKERNLTRCQVCMLEEKLGNWLTIATQGLCTEHADGEESKVLIDRKDGYEYKSIFGCTMCVEIPGWRHFTAFSKGFGRDSGVRYNACIDPTLVLMFARNGFACVDPLIQYYDNIQWQLPPAGSVVDNASGAAYKESRDNVYTKWLKKLVPLWMILCAHAGEKGKLRHKEALFEDLEQLEKQLKDTTDQLKYELKSNERAYNNWLLSAKKGSKTYKFNLEDHIKDEWPDVDDTVDLVLKQAIEHLHEDITELKKKHISGFEEAVPVEVEQITEHPPNTEDVPIYWNDLVTYVTFRIGEILEEHAGRKMPLEEKKFLADDNYAVCSTNTQVNKDILVMKQTLCNAYFEQKPELKLSSVDKVDLYNIWLDIKLMFGDPNDSEFDKGIIQKFEDYFGKIKFFD